jgi:hypothetical protein
MRKTTIVCLILVLAALVGCTTTVTTPGANVQTTGAKTTVQTSDANVQITTNSQGANDWCPAGGDWSAQATTTQGMASATWKVDKLMTSGKYAGMCHVIYTVKSAQGQDVNMEYYFNKDGKSGYVLTNVNGQSYATEWHS